MKELVTSECLHHQKWATRIWTGTRNKACVQGSVDLSSERWIRTGSPSNFRMLSAYTDWKEW